VVILLVGLAWGVIMFVVGRRSVELPKIDSDIAAAQAIGALVRIDQAIAQEDFSSARSDLKQLPIASQRLREAVTDQRLAVMDEKEAARAAAEAAAALAKTPAAIAARLQAHLWHVAIPDLAWHDPATAVEPPVAPPEAQPTVKEPANVPEQSNPPPGAAEQADLPKVPATSVPVVLAAEKLGERTFIPSARVVHPTDKQRVYVLHPSRGLLRSDDGGSSWRLGVAQLEKLTGTHLAFTAGKEPLLVIIGPDLWFFCDRDAAFFVQEH
jgi:hypothetical protein